jgi:hypothetical protein
MPGFTEWDLDHALHIFFSRHSQYMLVFQDSDLHNYTDRHLIPMTMMKLSSRKRLTRQCAETLRGRHISVDPQQFRPDAVLVGKDGRPCVLEAKVGRVNAEAECSALVVQALVYADLLTSPRWKPATRCQNSPASTTYDLLEDLHEAHWFLKVPDEGIYRPLEVRHRRYFRLESGLNREDFEKVPAVVFLLEGVNRARLEEACRRVKEMDFPSYKEHAELVLRKRVPFRKHFALLQGSWAKLQQIDFRMMRLDTVKFAEVIESEPELLLQ